MGVTQTPGSPALRVTLPSTRFRIMHSVKYAGAILISGLALWTYSSALHQVFTRGTQTLVARSFGGQLQFLTNLSLVISLVHQVLSVVALLTQLRLFAALQNWILIVSAPLEVYVAILYWPLRLYNRNLLLDKRFGLRLSPELDRQLHLYPAVFEFLSATIFAQRPWRAGILTPLALFAALSSGYWWWIERTFLANGFYPYPLFSFLSTEQKAALIAVSSVATFIVFKFIQYIQRQFR